MNYRAITALAAALFLSACSNKQQEITKSLVGPWVPQDDGTILLTFSDGGTFGMRLEGQQIATGTWSVSNTGGVAITGSNGAMPGTLNAGKLQVTFPNGSQHILVRQEDFSKSVPALTEDDMARMLYPTYQHNCDTPLSLQLYTGFVDQQRSGLYLTTMHVMNEKYFSTGYGPDLTELFQQRDAPGGMGQVTISVFDGLNFVAPERIGGILNVPHVANVRVEYCKMAVTSPQFDGIEVTATSVGSKTVSYFWKESETPISIALNNPAYSNTIFSRGGNGRTKFHANFAYRNSTWQVDPQS